MLRFFIVVTFIGAFFGALMLLAAFGTDNLVNSTAYGAKAVALVAIPYCVARLLWMTKQSDRADAIYKALLQIRDNQQP